jgi:Methyltransferase domain
MNPLRLLKEILRVCFNFVIYWRNQPVLFFRKLVRDQHQLTSVTASDRYPELFSEVRTIVGEKPNSLILSFGCSTGEECTTMLSYFPGAKIIGVDINRSNLRKAKRKRNHPNINFLHSTPKAIMQNGKYDLIFCLSVLCRWEETKDLENCVDIYPFSKFSQTVTMLADQVKKGGLLVVYNSNFRFEDTKAFSDFDIVRTPLVQNSGFVHKYDSSNDRVKSAHANCVYKKR